MPHFNLQNSAKIPLRYLIALVLNPHGPHKTKEGNASSVVRFLFYRRCGMRKTETESLEQREDFLSSRGGSAPAKRGYANTL